MRATVALAAMVRGAIWAAAGVESRMTSLWLSRKCLVVTGLILVAGCQHATTPVARPAEGASMFSFVERPVVAATEPTAQLLPMAREPVEVKTKAEPLEPLATPVYPRRALGRVPLPMMVGVRINVDASGRVAHVGASLVTFSTGGEYAEEFRAAVEAALALWRFRPAEMRHLEPRPGRGGQGGYWQVTRAEPTEDAFDLAFTFTAKGDVIAEGLR